MKVSFGVETNILQFLCECIVVKIFCELIVKVARTGSRRSSGEAQMPSSTNGIPANSSGPRSGTSWALAEALSSPLAKLCLRER